MKKTLIYLASPYTSSLCNRVEREVQQRRREQEVSCLAFRLLQEGDLVFCPISHGVKIQERTGFKLDWMGLDLTILGRCDKLYIADMDGWKDSAGINMEMTEARRLSIPMYLIEKDNLMPTRLH